MMQQMIDFSAVLLGLIAQFLASEPVLYLFGMIVFCFVCKGIKSLIGH